MQASSLQSPEEELDTEFIWAQLLSSRYIKNLSNPINNPPPPSRNLLKAIFSETFFLSFIPIPYVETPFQPRLVFGFKKGTSFFPTVVCIFKLPTT
jgi:hypothetical protein